MKKGRETDEYIITRLDHVTPPKNIVNIYGQQIDDYGEAVLLIGDMNRAVGSDDLGEVGNRSKVS